MKIIQISCALLMLLAPASASAQGEAVRPVPDWASYATAAVNPTWAATDAWRSSDRWCRLGQLAIAEGIGNAVSLTMKHYVVGERPCFACDPDGMPSGHSVNADIGFSRHVGWGLAFGFSTAALRVAAHRHTWPQVLTGLAIGAGADLGGRLLRCQD